MKVIYILWLRQIKRYLRSKARIVGSLGQPLLFLVALGFGLGPTFKNAGEGNYVQFLVPGMVAMGILFTSIFSGVEVIWDRKFGFLKETLVAPVPRFQIMLGRTLGGATVASIQGLLIFILSFFIGFRPASWLHLPMALIFMFLISLLFTALGTALASILEDMQGFQLIVNFLIMPLFFLSGALFPIRDLPKVLAVIINVNPLSYGVDGLRGAFSAASHFGYSLDLFVLSTVTLLFLFVGSYLFGKVEV